MSHIVIDARIRRSSTGRYVDRLLEHLQKIESKNTYTILVEKDDPWQGSADNFTPLPCPYKQFSFNPLEQIAFAWKLYRLRPALIHFTMPQQPFLYLGKRITTFHDLTFLSYPRQKHKSSFKFKMGFVLYMNLLKYVARLSKKIIVPSKFVASDLAAYQPSTKAKIVVTYEASEPSITAKAKPLSGVVKPFIMHVGSPFPHKNIDRLVESFSLLKKDHPSLQLVLPGKKEFYFNELQDKLTDNPLRDDIIIPGFISDEELKWLYENAECYVLPSLSEGFGLPGLEAMVHGCPVVSSNATCLPEIYGNAAHYFNPEDTEDMMRKITGVITNKKLRDSLVKSGHNQVKKYSWQRMAEQTLKVYNDALRS